MTRRGYAETDATDFSKDALGILAKAGEECSYLIDRGYPRDTVISFVGNRYQMTARQRLFLARYVSGDAARRGRAAKRLALDEMAGRDISIDGFNAIITLEVALSGAPVVLCEDGTMRDLAGLRGTYHPLDCTPRAIALILDTLERHHARSALFLLDAPVSNSGRLRQVIGDVAKGRNIAVTAEVSDSVDRTLRDSSDIVTSDSVVLDGCVSWFDLDAEIVEELRAGGADVWLIDLRGQGCAG